MPLLVCILLAAAPATHRARAERAEALGRIPQAADAYEAAWEEEQAPDLLYRLGLARRKLRQYGKSREAFRAYLRFAPDGGLRQEVERQLSRLDVLIEASAEEFGDTIRKVTYRIPEFPPAAIETSFRFPAAPPMRVSLSSGAAAPLQYVPLGPAPAARSRSGIWLATGAAAVAVTAGFLWWDGARAASQLDARFAAGELTAHDGPAYRRARTESVAGRVLAVVAAALAAGAVALW